MERALGRFFNVLVDHSVGRDGRLHGVISLPVLLVTLLPSLIAITPFAYAPPCDQTWITGIYDEADYDDVVGFVTEGMDASTPERLAHVVEEPAICGVLPVEPPQVPTPKIRADLSRGPPHRTVRDPSRCTTSSLLPPFTSPDDHLEFLLKVADAVGPMLRPAPRADVIGVWGADGTAFC